MDKFYFFHLITHVHYLILNFRLTLNHEIKHCFAVLMGGITAFPIEKTFRLFLNLFLEDEIGEMLPAFYPQTLHI